MTAGNGMNKQRVPADKIFFEVIKFNKKREVVLVEFTRHPLNIFSAAELLVGFQIIHAAFQITNGSFQKTHFLFELIDFHIGILYRR